MDFRRILVLGAVGLMVAGARFALQMENRALTQSRSGEEAEATPKRTMPKVSFFSLNKNVKAMKLTSLDQPINQACLTNHAYQDAGFSSAVSTKDGCACTAKYVTSQIAPDHLSEYMRLHAVVLNSTVLRKTAKTDEQKDLVEDNWNYVSRSMQAKSTLPRAKFQSMVGHVGRVHSLCASPKSFTPAGLEKLAAMQPIGYAEAIEAAARDLEESKISLRNAELGLISETAPAPGLRRN